MLGWLGFSAIGAVPFVIIIDSSFLDGLFEAMSGFTTTGITVYTGLDHMPKSLLFWRALTQLIGGIGILSMFLPISSAGGGAHHLFGAEGHKIKVSRPVPGLENTVKLLVGIYLSFTAGITLLLFFAGMPLFDSLCHSFAALATGGYSPYDASVEQYRLIGHPNYILLEYILILSMVLGGINFLVHSRVIRGEFKALVDNSEIRYWWSLIGGFVLLSMLERFVRIEPLPRTGFFDPALWLRIEEDFRITLF